MKFQIDPGNIDTFALAKMFSTIEKALADKKGLIQLTQLLSIMNFPTEINNKILKSRGPLQVSCNGSNCSASNFGGKIEENLPGSGGTLGIIIKERFSCLFRIDVNDKIKTLTIDQIEGLHADLPGPWNPDVNKITVRLPKYVMLDV